METRTNAKRRRNTKRHRIFSSFRKEAVDVLIYCRQYLSFRDICATRAVCKEWQRIDAFPIYSTVYLGQENEGYPDWSDKDYLSCILAAKIYDLEIEIESQDQIHFLNQIIESIKKLSMVVEMGPYDTEWKKDIFGNMVHLEELEFDLYGIDFPVTIDFSKMPRLKILCTNGNITFLKYDNRQLELLKYSVDYWDETLSKIAEHTQTIRLHRHAKKSDVLLEYLDIWVNDTSKKPDVWELCVQSSLFFSWAREGITIHPVEDICHINDEHYTGSFLEYERCLMQVFMRMPNIPLSFSECDAETQSNWKILINRIGNKYGYKLK